MDATAAPTVPDHNTQHEKLRCENRFAHELSRTQCVSLGVSEHTNDEESENMDSRIIRLNMKTPEHKKKKIYLLGTQEFLYGNNILGTTGPK